MRVATLIIPAALLLTMAGAIFGIILARIVWQDEATQAAKLKSDCEGIEQVYNEIHKKDQETIAIQRETMDMMKR